MCEFENIKDISSGSFGNVHSVDINNQSYALKVYKNSSIDIILNNIIEIDILFNISNQNLIKGYDILDLEECSKNIPRLNKTDVGILLELGSDKNIQRLTKNISIENLFNISYKYLIDITLGCQCLIESGYLHTDIKPENILINVELQKFYLVDYGIMIPIRDEMDEIKGAGGTRIYKSPSQLYNFNNVKNCAYSIILSVLILFTNYDWNFKSKDKIEILFYMMDNIPKLLERARTYLDYITNVSSKKIKLFRDIINYMDFFKTKKTDKSIDIYNFKKDYETNFLLTPRMILHNLGITLKDCFHKPRPMITRIKSVRNFLKYCNNYPFSVTCLALTLYLRFPDDYPGLEKQLIIISSNFYDFNKSKNSEYFKSTKDVLKLLKKLDYMIYDNDLYRNAPSVLDIIDVFKMTNEEIISFINNGCNYPNYERYPINETFSFSFIKS